MANLRMVWISFYNDGGDADNLDEALIYVETYLIIVQMKMKLIGSVARLVVVAFCRSRVTFGNRFFKHSSPDLHEVVENCYIPLFLHDSLQNC